eukprot:2388919-Pyramimonas_sp.AAC.2
MEMISKAATPLLVSGGSMAGREFRGSNRCGAQARTTQGVQRFSVTHKRRVGHSSEVTCKASCGASTFAKPECSKPLTWGRRQRGSRMSVAAVADGRSSLTDDWAADWDEEWAEEQESTETSGGTGQVFDEEGGQALMWNFEGEDGAWDEWENDGKPQKRSLPAEVNCCAYVRHRART